MSNLSTPTENIVLPEPSEYNPTRNNKSGVTPVPDDFTETDLQIFERKVKSKQAEVISHSGNLMTDYSQQIATANANSAQDLQIVANLRTQSNIEPPLWFANFEMRLETRLNGMETRFNGMETRFNRLETGLNGLRYLAMRSENEKKRSFHEIVEPVPFLDGSNPPDTLHPISSVDDIQRMSKPDVLSYLHGYGVRCANTESIVNLKVKLRVAVGLTSPPDLAVIFSSSSRTRGD